MKKLFKDNITKNTLILIIGSGIAKVIGILAIPLLTRIYDPREFGAYSIVLSTMLVLAPIATLRYATAIPLPRRESTAFLLLILSASFIIIFSLLIISFFLFLPLELQTNTTITILVDNWPLILLGTICLSGLEIASNWSTRQKMFRLLSKNSIVQAIVGNISKILFGLLHSHAASLILGSILQLASGTFFLILQFKNDLKKHYKSIRFGYILIVFKYYLNYIYLKLPSHLFSIIALHAPIFLTSWLYGLEMSGQLSLTFMALNIPLMLFIHSTTRAYYGEISQIGKNDISSIFNLTKTTIIKMGVIGLLPCVAIFFLSPFAFQIVFGSQWALAGNFASIMSVALFFQFISTPIMTALDVLNKQSTALALNLSRAALAIAVFIIGHGMSYTYSSIIVLYSGALSAHYLFTTFVVLASLLRARPKGNF